MAKAEKATWTDVKATQADVITLRARLKTLVSDQADTVKSGLEEAARRLDVAGRIIETRATDARDTVIVANLAMLDSGHKTAQSFGAAVAAARSRLADATAPKTVAS